jgi:uncharacterized protein YcfL
MKRILALLIAVMLLAGCASEQIIPLDEPDDVVEMPPDLEDVLEAEQDVGDLISG